MASIAVRVRLPGLADQSIGVRVRMLRRGPDLQDTTPSPLPQNLLVTFLLSEWCMQPASGRLRAMAIFRAPSASSAVALGPMGHPAAMRGQTSIATARQGRPWRVRT